MLHLVLLLIGIAPGVSPDRLLDPAVAVVGDVEAAAVAGHDASGLHVPDIRAGLRNTIRGRVLVAQAERPPRRRARSYGGVTIPTAPQEIPRLVWIRGEIAGHPPARSGPPRMAQQDTAFVPAFATVPMGGSVIFPNRDDFFHNVFSYTTGSRFDLGAYAEGEEKEVRFEEPGLVSVFCEVHDRMRAAILVVENSFWAVVDEDGTFEFTGVPDGQWTVVAWDPDRGISEVTVEVSGGSPVDVTIEVG